jgi:hypothetical protein
LTAGDESEYSSTEGGWWVRQPFVTKAALASEPTQRRIQSRFDRADQFPGVMKLCRRNGGQVDAECRRRSLVATTPQITSNGIKWKKPIKNAVIELFLKLFYGCGV